MQPRSRRLRFVCLLGAAALVALSVHSLTAKDAEAPKTTEGKGPQAAAPISTKDISLDQAHVVLMAAMEKARSLNIKEDIAVVDAGGNLKTFARMDDAWIGSIDISIKKARTSRLFNMPTGEVGKLSQPGKPLYQIEVSNGGLITFPGGVPLKESDGTVIGAIGASGSTVENDDAVARAGLEALGQTK